MGRIYIVINLLNWKIYIGKWEGEKVEIRWEDHKNGRGSEHLHRSIQKYGVAHFYFGVLHENVPKEFLGDLEKQEIARYNCNSCRGGWGYNKTDGGDGASGYKWTDEQRERFSGENHPMYEKKRPDEICRRLSESQKEVWKDPEHKQKRAKINKESQNRPEVKRTHVENAKTRWNDPEYQEKQSQANKRPEVRERKSVATKELWNNPEYRETMSEKQKEVWTNPEYRETMSEKRKQVWNDPEYRENQSEVFKEVQNRPEVKRKKSARMKGQNNPMKNPNIRQKHTEAMSIPELKHSRSENAKKLWEDPEYRRKQTKAKKGKKHKSESRRNMSKGAKEAQNRPEVKKKQSKAAKERWNRYRKKIYWMYIVSLAIYWDSTYPHVSQQHNESQTKQEIEK